MYMNAQCMEAHVQCFVTVVVFSYNLSLASMAPLDPLVLSFVHSRELIFENLVLCYRMVNCIYTVP